MINLNEFNVSGEIVSLKELDGEFKASLIIKGTATREGAETSQILELTCLLQDKVYKDALQKGLKLYKKATVSGHIESWQRVQPNGKVKTKVIFITDYIYDVA